VAGVGLKKSVKVEASLPEIEWRNIRPAPVIGVDEVGRGCLAGDVYAAAVILPEDFAVDGVTDSKLLSGRRRESLELEILSQARVCVAFATVEEIAEFNILQATFLAMRRAIEGLAVGAGHVLVDGNQKIPRLPPAFQQTTVIKGDLRALPIAAASIVAKVARDRYMTELAKAIPQYGLEKHKGYGSPEHREAIQRFGPSPHHRRTFAGVREYWPAPESGAALSAPIDPQGTLF
jgi:ribonuclease HII